MASVEIETEEQGKVPVTRTLDGYAYSYTDKRGSYLVVFPPQGDGKTVDLTMVEGELHKANIEALDLDRVRAAVMAATGKPAWILTSEDPDEAAARAKAQAEAEAAAAAAAKAVDKSQWVFVTLSEDGVSAKLTIVPPDQNATVELTMDDVQKVINDHGIAFGLNEDRLTEAQEVIDRIRDGESTEPVELEIAHGVEPEHGLDAQIEYFFEKTGEAAEKAKVEETDEGKVDYFGVKEIENTKRGQMIARRIPPTRGTPGKSVKGEEIPARDGTEGAITIGRGVEHALGNENILVAAVDGQVKHENNTLEVLAIYEVNGDVDISTGSIDFIGTVIVKSNVQPGLKITAGEDVVVEGVVDDAEINAAGKVTIKGGILGQGGKAKITAGGDVNAKYIRNATIETKGTLIAHEGILHCHVNAHSVKLTGKRGQIVGGEINAEVDIVANTIGSNTMATPTILNVGMSAARQQEINTLTEQAKKMEEELDKASKNAKTLTEQRERTGSLDPNKTRMLTMLNRAILKLQNDIKPAKERLAQVLSEEEEQRKHHQAKISVLGTLYPGVKVQIRSAKRHIVEEQRYCTLTEKGADIRVGPYK